MVLGSEFRAEAERSIGLGDTRAPGSVNDRLHRNGRYLGKRILGMVVSAWLIGYLALAFSGYHAVAIGFTFLAGIFWFAMKIRRARTAEFQRTTDIPAINENVRSC